MISLRNMLAAASVASCMTLLSLPVLAQDFRLGLITPPSHHWTQAAQSFAQTLNERSEGRHSVSVFPAAQLGNEAQMVQQLQTGALDMAFLTVAEVSNRVPEFGAWYAPYLVDDIDEAAALLRSDAAESMFELLPQQAGLVGIGYGMAGMRQMMSRTPVNSPADLQGKKLRITPFDPIRDFYAALNTAPTPLPLPAVYDALANRQIDAIDMDFDSILIFRFYERAEHLLISNHMMFPMVGVVSARVWRNLDAEDQALITELMKTELDQVIETFRLQERDQEAELRALNITITEADRESFADSVAAWEAIWSEKSQSLGVLRDAVEQIRNP
ncbi:MAG: TRAP transporter substrate-binding protein [Nitrincola lacisaponensis]|uniref:TRAP-type C4-dicarboxylate transport system, periplasmic component n=1 Tax=Nitrincola lacisaponensis TaxID=267850 RepID=A0A063Y686_9GAMM|nr:TRAP transporter substrate-binding protein [Nitrincola lacisaponensis]KDE40276.1 TRAP-type C4-dicarboxylate transport system, periplasmic component [Nitrincola lacisaponensis]